MGSSIWSTVVSSVGSSIERSMEISIIKQNINCNEH